MGNVWAATRHISTYVCPSNPFNDPAMRDPAGFGGTDYFATVYTDIDPAPASDSTAAATRPCAQGALTVDTTHIITVTSGTNTSVTTTARAHQRAASAPSATAPATPSR